MLKTKKSLRGGRQPDEAIRLLLVLTGIRLLHLRQRGGYGGLGTAGYRLTIAGYISMVVIMLPGVFNIQSQALWAGGFVFGLIAGLLVFTGWLVWGTASARAKSLPGWRVVVPFYMGLAFLAWISDPTGYGLNPETVRVFLQGIGFIVLGAILWGRIRKSPTSIPSISVIIIVFTPMWDKFMQVSLPL